MATEFHFERRVGFEVGRAEEIVREVPAAAGVFALRGEREQDEPYLMRGADMRRRLMRLLAAPEVGADGLVVQSKRLNLRNRVRWIEWTVTGSEFESLLLLYEATAAAFGVEAARKRMRLYAPYCLRLTMEHAHPRVYSTNRLSGRNLARTYGPFPSRLAADRYCDAVMDLFKLRRCWEDLEVHAEHPGCAYGEMKKCMAPCNTTCSAEEYAGEAVAVEAFFRTHGDSMLAGIAVERERASAEMEFEAAAAAHERYGKVKAAAGLADELVRPVPELRGVIVQRVAGGEEAQEAAVFLLRGGRLYGPERLSTLGVRAVKEQTSVGSSLFAQPLMLAAVPLGEGTGVELPEDRCAGVLARLEARAVQTQVSTARPFDKLRAGSGAPGSEVGSGDMGLLGDHLSLLRRWYYRPENQRVGEFFFANADGSWPIRRILRGAARLALGDPKAMAETDRAGAAVLAASMGTKTKVLHEGREGVERVVPDSGAKPRRGRKKAVVPGDVVQGPLE